jgi:hypothetical protein
LPLKSSRTRAQSITDLVDGQPTIVRIASDLLPECAQSGIGR